LGFSARTDGTVIDVLAGSPVARAGVGPGVKIVAVNGRATGKDLQAQLETALTTAHGGPPIHLLLLGGDVYRDVAVDYRGGPRYPRLERIAGTPDLLSRVAAVRAR
jgi:predicted metalloprotease with PDZ domain